MNIYHYIDKKTQQVRSFQKKLEKHLRDSGHPNMKEFSEAQLEEQFREFLFNEKTKKAVKK